MICSGVYMMFKTKSLCRVRLVCVITTRLPQDSNPIGTERNLKRGKHNKNEQQRSIEV